jgi:hypothetical protein
MATADQLKSGRKKFMVMRVKSSIMQILNTPDEDVDTELNKLLDPLMKTFGDDEGQEILNLAIEAADRQFTEAIQQAIVESTAANMGKEKA